MESSERQTGETVGKIIILVEQKIENSRYCMLELEVKEMNQTGCGTGETNRSNHSAAYSHFRSISSP